MIISFRVRDSRTSQTVQSNDPTSRPRVSRWAYLLLIGLALPSSASWAQTNANADSSGARSGGFVGLGANFAPRYQGADESRTMAIPGFVYQWSNGLFVGGTDGLVGFQFNATPQLKLGAALGLDEGREASDSRYLNGMGNVSSRGTFNLLAKAAISEQLELSAALRMGSGNNSKGGLFNLGATYGIVLAPDTRMSFNVEATLANADYMQEYFGVSSEQASASGYKRYTPSSGLRDVTVGLDFQHDLSRDWMVFGKVSSTSLSNAAKDSPLVRKTTSQSAFAGIAYKF